jgi:hypothetical protein
MNVVLAYPQPRGNVFDIARLIAISRILAHPQLSADFDHIESHKGVVAGLVPATPAF